MGIVKRILQFCFLAIGLFTLSSSFATTPIFTLTTSNQSTTVSPGGTALIGYTVQNVSGINMTKIRYFAPPLTTITAGTCGDTLANHASCSVTLTLHAPNTQGRMTLGSFAVCGKNGKACSQPDKFNLVHVIITPVTSTFTITPSAGANGAINPSTPQTVNAGNSLMFTAIPNTGYQVNQWLVDGVPVQSGGNTYTLTNITANHTIAVTFSIMMFVITPSAGANGSISPNTPQTVDYGSDLMFTATPNTGYLVNQWLVDGTVVQTGGTTFTLTNITANHTVSVTFVIQTFTVTPSAGANGAISPSTPQTVDYGSNIMFTATPNTGYLVDQWFVDGVSVQTGGTTFTLTNVTADHTVSVTFIIQTFTVTPSAGANGSISPNTPQTVDYGSNIMFTATPDATFTVNQWSVDGTPVQTGGTTFTLTNVTANHTVSVTFTIQTFTVTPSAGANGAISPSTAQTVDYGSNIMFTATPNTGYNVNQWSVDGTPVQTGGTTYTLTNVTANHTVSVTFVIQTFTVTPSAGANGSISPSTPQTVDYGSNIMFTATPNTGYLVDQWFVDGVSVQTGGTTFTLTNVTADHTVSVTFVIQTFTVTPSAGANGSISPSTPQTVNYNASIMFTATPNTGYNVDQWLVDGTLVQTGGTTFTLNNVTADHTVEVTFTIQTFTVTPSTGGNGSISPSTPQTVNYGSSVMFTATPNANFQVNQWLVDGTVVQTEGTTYTLSNVTANHTVQVTFIRVALLYVASASSIVSVCTLNANDTVNTCSTAANGFFAASGISINPAGTIAYVVDAGTAIYYCPVNANGTLGTCNDTGSGGATFPFVLRIDFNPAGTLAYVSNGAGSQDIFYCTLNADGSFNVCTLSTPSGTTLGAPVGMWVNPANSIIYIADSTQQSATYCAIVSGGNLGTCGAASQLFNNPREVLLNVAGTFLYVSDIDGNQLYYCVVNGDGSLGACNTTGTGFNRPDGLATNLAGTVLYIGNNGSKVVFACPINANGTLGTCVSKSITAGVADVYYLP